MTDEDVIPVRFDLVTPWRVGAWRCLGDDHPGVLMESPLLHAIYAQIVAHLVESECPWLVPMLAAAGARVFAGPNFFAVEGPHGQLDHVPELAAQLPPAQWVDPSETRH